MASSTGAGKRTELAVKETKIRRKGQRVRKERRKMLKSTLMGHLWARQFVLMYCWASTVSILGFRDRQRGKVHITWSLRLSPAIPREAL